MAGHGGGGTGPLASKTRAMILKSLVPLVQVRNLRRSVDFYRTLGFAEENTHTPEGGSEPVWAWLTSGGAQIMLAQAGEPVDAEKQAVLFYLYSPDVPGFRNMLIEAGVDAGPIQHPSYAPRGEFRVTDPDGYVLMVTHT
jgi:catechol 2,3-dioxygenase-like lactoylglutathione lyase family enzyme